MGHMAKRRAQPVTAQHRFATKVRGLCRASRHWRRPLDWASAVRGNDSVGIAAGGSRYCVRGGREHDRLPRQAAIDRVRQLARHSNDDMVPLDALRAGFQFRGERISFGSFMSGIYRPKELHGPAALAIVTAPPKEGKPAPYEDTFDDATGTSPTASATRKPTRSPRTPGRTRQPHPCRRARACRPAHLLPGIAPSQYVPLAPVFVTSVDVAARTAWLQVGSRSSLRSSAEASRPTTPGATRRARQPSAFITALPARRARRRLPHPLRVCSLRRPLSPGAHIIGDGEQLGHATVVNGVALCAIHHLAYDRNLMGIDPTARCTSTSASSTRSTGRCFESGLKAFHVGRNTAAASEGRAARSRAARGAV